MNFLFIIFIICFNQNMNAQNSECNFWSENHLTIISNNEYFNQTVYLVQFKDYAELVNIPCKTGIDVNYFGVRPTSTISYQTNFEILILFKMFKFDWKYQKVSVFLNFDGFNKQSKNAKSSIFLADYSIQFKESNFDFYLDNQSITKSMCIKENFNESYFGHITKLYFLQHVFYTKNICPYVFAKTELNELGLSGITNSLLFKNRLNFMTLNETVSIDSLNTKTLNTAILQVFYENIDQRLLNVHVFRNLRVLSISGIIYKIEEDLVKELNSIKEFILRPSDLGRFYQQDNLAWASRLNFNRKKINLLDDFDVRMNMDMAIVLEIFEGITFFGSGYSYPDEDFCVFKNFPHEKLVYPSIKLVENEYQCSCTLFWLIQYSKFYMTENSPQYESYLYSNKPDINISLASSCLKNVDLKSEIEKCNFKERLEKCNLTNVNKELPFHGNNNGFFMLEWLKYILQVYVQTIFCLLGLFTNFLTFMVVRKTTKPLDKPMYRHIYFLSIFNFFICLFTLVSLINVCIFPKTSFCSSIMTSQLSQYFKIYMIYFLNNCLRLMSNISHIFFSLSRFFLATSHTNKFTENFEKLNLKKFYLLLFIICLSFSSFKIFEYRINIDFGLAIPQFPYSTYDIAYCVFDPFFSLNHVFKCKFFQIMNVINNTLNNIVIFLVNIFIDILLLRYIREKIKRKKMSHRNNEAELSLNHDKATKKKVIKLLIVNAFLTFFSRMPAFAATIFLIAYKNQLSEFCFSFFSCTEIVAMAQAFELFSISLQFFILKKFDNNFSFEFDSLINRIFKV